MMTDAEIKKAFARQIARILEEIERNEREVIGRTVEYVKTLRLEVIARLAEHGSEFNVSVYRQVTNGLDAALREFTRQLTLELNDSMEEFHNLGLRLASEPIALITPAQFAVNRTALQIATTYSTDLVRGLSNDIRKSINAIIRRTVAGVITPNEAIKQMGTSVEAGVFRSAKARAETIVRTEVLRVQSIASFARLKQSKAEVNKIGWNLTRQWITAEDERVRVGHELTHGQEREAEEEFDVPIIVKGVPVGTEKLLYPRDEKASAANVINCRCAVIPVLIRLE